MQKRILIVDDDPLLLAGFQRSLGRRFSLDTATGGEKALELLRDRGPYAVVVSDMRMPGIDGLEFLTKLKAMQPDTVRIMLTGNADQETAVKAVNEGSIFKFLTKPCGTETMISALETGWSHYCEKQHDRDLMQKSAAALKDLTSKLCHQSQYDTLTDLANRKSFELRLQSALESAQREGREHALCHLNLDHFHVVNDACGHRAGDALLRQVGQTVSSQPRRADMVGRLTGDEFGILLGDCSMQEAQRIVEGLHKSLTQTHFAWNDKLFPISASIGLVPVTGESQSVAALFSAAETACHVAQDLGCNRVHVGDAQDRELSGRLDAVQWVERINNALQENRFRLYFQTIMPISVTEERGDHYELLIRMEDTQGNIIPPGKFLSVAETYHLSPQIDRWVIGAAVDWFSHHPRSLERLSLCSINLSGHSLGNPKMHDFILRKFSNSKVTPEKFCFEVTETAAITRLESAMDFIKTLKAAGFRFALDDFGTGVSSFAYLKALPVDFLKIDGTFVKQMNRDAVDRAMVKSINETGHVMGKKTIAEFIENEEIVHYLQELAVDYGQGYVFTPPRPIDDLE